MSVGHSRPDQPQALAAPLRLLGQEFLQMCLDPILSRAGVLFR